MKTKLALSIAAVSILLSGNAFAGAKLSEGQMLGQCKSLAKAQFEDVRKVKMTKMTNRRGLFSAKFRVTAESDKGMFLCTIEKNAEPQIVRLDKSDSNVAAK